MKPHDKPLTRLRKACLYSWDGLVSAMREEAAFRQELALFALSLPILYLLDIEVLFKLLLLAAGFLVIVTELLNSAIEAIVDMVAPEFHPLAKKAKDTGSAAVLISLILAGTLWTAAVVLHLLN